MAQKLPNESCFFVIFVFLKHFTHYRLFFNSVANTFLTTLGNLVFFFQQENCSVGINKKNMILEENLGCHIFRKKAKV